MESLERQLRRYFPDEILRMRLIDRVSYASDAGFYHLIPKAVILPRHEDDICRLMQLAGSHQIPVVFRAGGTSLSGQSITDGILVDLSRYWKKIQVSPDARTVFVQPGITGGMVNHHLRKYGRKIGPDPASIQAAMMGGILSNNASGMCCGVVHNAYHTLQSIRFVLADGKAYSTAVQLDYTRFEREQAQLCRVLQNSRQAIISRQELHDRIRRKYLTKNTVGYSLNALIDYEHPLDIFAHLLIGGEGTLAFISGATLLTLPDYPCKAAAMLYFPDIRQACAAIVPLKESGVEALELMDRASLKSVEHLPGLPDFFPKLPEGAAALLCEYQTETPEALQSLLQASEQLLAQLPLLHPARFTAVEKERQRYWKMRKGMFPSVGAMRRRGTTVMLEDVAVPVNRLGDAITDLKVLFEQFGYTDAIIFGHAKDGNIHFVVTQMLDTDAEIARYDAFMQEVVKLVVHRYDGALKAEHGTGRNMAPFVETEWGGEAYAMMKAIKQAADPANLLNPGVIINDNSKAHITGLRTLPQVEEEVDKCIECGFCEINCPSRDLTMTPRRRIVARRALQRMRSSGDHRSARQLLKEYRFEGLETCATDGLCATDCPVDINTGDLVKRLRKERHGSIAKSVAGFMARRYALVETAVRTVIGLLARVDGIGGGQWLARFTSWLHRRASFIPVWMSEVKAAPPLPKATDPDPDVIYFVSCINRVMHQQGAEAALPEVITRLCRQAGYKVWIPAPISGFCCGQPFSSKGFSDAGRQLLKKTIDALYTWSREGSIPVICDFSSCTYTFLEQASRLPEGYREKWKQITVTDSVAFLEKQVLPVLNPKKLTTPVVLHPTCAVTKLHLRESLTRLAEACASEVTVPAGAGCCGMAGDRGFLVPELISSAIREEGEEVSVLPQARGYASASTCEMALTRQTGVPYRHIAYLLEEASATEGNP